MSALSALPAHLKSAAGEGASNVQIPEGVVPKKHHGKTQSHMVSRAVVEHSRCGMTRVFSLETWTMRYRACCAVRPTQAILCNTAPLRFFEGSIF